MNIFGFSSYKRGHGAIFSKRPQNVKLMTKSGMLTKFMAANRVQNTRFSVLKTKNWAHNDEVTPQSFQGFFVLK